MFAAEKTLQEEIRTTQLEFSQSKSRLAASSFEVSQRRDVLAHAVKTRDVMEGEYQIDTRSLKDLIDAEEAICEATVELNESNRRQLKDKLRVL